MKSLAFQKTQQVPVEYHPATALTLGAHCALSGLNNDQSSHTLGSYMYCLTAGLSGACKDLGDLPSTI